VADVDKPCLDCGAIVTFPSPGDATCGSCGLRMFMNDAGQTGRYPPVDWEPGRLQRKHPSRGQL
jgi:hypothetical protein